MSRDGAWSASLLPFPDALLARRRAAYEDMHPPRCTGVAEAVHGELPAGGRGGRLACSHRCGPQGCDNAVHLPMIVMSLRRESAAVPCIRHKCTATCTQTNSAMTEKVSCPGMLARNSALTRGQAAHCACLRDGQQRKAAHDGPQASSRLRCWRRGCRGASRSRRRRSHLIPTRP